MATVLVHASTSSDSASMVTAGILERQAAVESVGGGS